MGFFCGLLLGFLIGSWTFACSANNLIKKDLQKFTYEELKKKYLK